MVRPVDSAVVDYFLWQKFRQWSMFGVLGSISVIEAGTFNIHQQRVAFYVLVDVRDVCIVRCNVRLIYFFLFFRRIYYYLGSPCQLCIFLD